MGNALQVFFGANATLPELLVTIIGGGFVVLVNINHICLQTWDADFKAAPLTLDLWARNELFRTINHIVICSCDQDLLALLRGGMGRELQAGRFMH